MSKSNTESSGGCLGLIIGILIAWAFCFGVTFRGVHYGVDLSCKDGVTVQGVK